MKEHEQRILETMDFGDQEEEHQNPLLHRISQSGGIINQSPPQDRNFSNVMKCSENIDENMP